MLRAAGQGHGAAGSGDVFAGRRRSGIDENGGRRRRRVSKNGRGDAGRRHVGGRLRGVGTWRVMARGRVRSAFHLTCPHPAVRASALVAVLVRQAQDSLLFLSPSSPPHSSSHPTRVRGHSNLSPQCDIDVLHPQHPPHLCAGRAPHRLDRPPSLRPLGFSSSVLDPPAAQPNQARPYMLTVLPHPPRH